MSSKEALRSRPITLYLKIHINHFAILFYGSPQVMLFAVDRMVRHSG